MKTLDLASLPQGLSRTSPWGDRLGALMDRWLTSDALYRWSVSNPLTRWITRRRARQVFDLMAGFVYSQVLLACVRLRILEAVAERQRSLDELAQWTHLPPAGLQRLLQSPLALGLLHVSDPDYAIVDVLARLTHDANAETAQAAIFALGLVAAGTNNSRVAGL